MIFHTPTQYWSALLLCMHICRNLLTFRYNYKLVCPYCSCGEACSAVPHFDGPRAGRLGHAAHEASWGYFSLCIVDSITILGGKIPCTPKNCNVEMKTTFKAHRHISRHKTNVHSNECIHTAAYSMFKPTLSQNYGLIEWAAA